MAAQLDFDGERVIPGKTPAYLSWAHAARYRFVRELVKGRKVLDAGSGAGYGTSYLAQYCKEAVGVDVSPEAVEFARSCYQMPNLSYHVMDCTALEFPAGTFDLACSFEVIEHLQNPSQFLSEIQRVLKPGGTFVVSTPNTESRFPSGDNPFHVKEYNTPEFVELLSPYFASVDCYGQVCKKPVREFLFMQSTRLYLRSQIYRGLINGVAPLYLKRARAAAPPEAPDWVDRVHPDTFDFTKGSVGNATYIVAVCRTAHHA